MSMHCSPSNSPRRRQPRRATGFTLIELMICIAVVGILSSVAYPAFSGTLATTRRSDALVALMKVQVLQERFRADHPTYGSLLQLGLDSASPARHYEIEMLEHTATGFSVHASAVGGQQRDTPCRHLRLAVDGLNVVYTSGATDETDNASSANRRCWSL
ncbi:MAG: type IV pilin protein [Burkholderiaceae bacterium]|nr:type IV pilin protein [Burkholderiaceae bacterium]